MDPGKYLSRDLFKKGESVKVKVAESCPTLCNPTDDTVHGILQARILEWVAFPFSRGSSQPRDRTQVSCTAGGFFTSWALREVPERGKRQLNGLLVWLTGVNVETLTVTHLSLSRTACSSDSRCPARRTHTRPWVKGPGRPSPTRTGASVSHLARPKAIWNAAQAGFTSEVSAVHRVSVSKFSSWQKAFEASWLFSPPSVHQWKPGI